ncbi:XRE family transcriptional regulator [Flavobacterium psychrophilum]|uniref:XRE family transcriptional regulator n=1 Tax=Flavobacterium psychrophilum TaxID=96345 RepID=UPI000AA0E72D|nr:LexA family transcriptional regulator [Flavobacterium psychrophilum]
MSISLKIKELRKNKKLTQKEFSSIIKIDDSQFSKIEQGKLQPTLNQLLEISSNFNISLDDLCFDKETHDDNVINEPSEIYTKTQKTTIGIPLIPIEAMAGYGGGETQVLQLDCEYFSVPTFKGADFLIQVKGSSMYPKYNSGDIVACKKLQLNDLFFQWNKVYVLDTEQGAIIKRIDIGPDDDHVMIVSDNEKYRPFSLHKSKINAISIVMGVIRLE